MSRLSISSLNQVESVLDGIYKYMERHMTFNPKDTCPIDISAAFLKLYMTQSCGKCTPCRVGLRQLSFLLDKVLNHEATLEDLDKIEHLARHISISADCAIGSEAAKMILKGVEGFRDEYVSHIEKGICLAERTESIPCMAACPAHINIPGYISLVGEGRYADAVRLIIHDNPLPAVCALICEHPCESRCRRTLLDAPINIRGLKRMAVDHMDDFPVQKATESTGRKIAVVGGGPSGLTVAAYLQRMGHQVTIYEKHKQLGGMLIYGIPAYRLPRKYLQKDIDKILELGVQVKLNTEVGSGELTIENLKKEYDAVYVSIGAHQAKSMGIEGEDSEGVISAVDYLGKLGDNEVVDFTGKKVLIVGGGNVAMDCSRSAVRCGAESVTIVYRRRREDMTALEEEIEGAIAEGVNLLTLHAPVKIEEENGKAVALWVKPNMVGRISGGTRMNPVATGTEDLRIDCDVIIKAIGQEMDPKPFADSDIPLSHGLICASDWPTLESYPGVFAGGDCVTGPKTAIMAIGAGKVAAANIDEYLGYHHVIPLDVEVPDVVLKDREYYARVDMKERAPSERRNDFALVEIGMNEKEACQEAGRCLRCDHYNCGIIRGGKSEW